MKNKLMVNLLLGGFGIFLLTGCGSTTDKVVCKVSEEAGELTMAAEVTATLNDDKVESVTAEITFNSENTAASYYNILMGREEATEEESKLKAKLDGNKITIENFEYTIEKNNDEEGSIGIKIIGESKDNFISIMESDQYSCE